MKQDLKPTRAELREVKRKLGVVRRGHGLLKRKQEALMVEFFRGLAHYRNMEKEAAEVQRASARGVARAEMASGRMGVWSFALTRTGRMRIQNVHKPYMGVALPDLNPVLAPDAVSGLVPGEHPQNMEAANSAEELLRRFVSLAGVEARIRVILAEIERTKRRVNALELRIMPQLEQDRAFVQSHLDEMEREGLFTLKRVRAKVGIGK